MERVDHLKIPLQQIKLATDNFASENLLGCGGFGPVYKGQVCLSGQLTSVAIKRLDSKSLQGNRELLTEITMLASYKHENLVSLVGFCDEGEEKILVYELLIHGSLDKYLNKTDLTWTQRLQICLGAANGLRYLHCHAGTGFRILHRDIKSSNILLDEEWKAKISDFGLSRIGPSNQLVTFLVSNVCGTPGYVDPQYWKTGILTKESDIYSFGVMLFEVLCGRPAVMQNYEDERRFLAPFAEFLHEQDRLDEIINPNLMRQMNPSSLRTFSTIAYQCLKYNRAERPTIHSIIEELQFALDLQLGDLNVMRVGPWGGSGGSNWNFRIPRNHKLKKIIVDHEDWIHALTFATKDPNGQLHQSGRLGGCGPQGRKISKIKFDADEEIIEISGTVGLTTGAYLHTVVSSLSFVTNKKTHGPFGKTAGTAFSVAFNKGELAGFYGGCGFYLDRIGFCFSVVIQSQE